MSSLAAQPSRRVLADLITRPATRSRAVAVDVGLVVAGAALVALLAKVAVPMWPVPITGQTLGVILVGAALGSRRGAAALTTYMLAGLAGAPVFATALAGPAYVLSPSFGFIVGFIPAAFVAGWVAERAWDRRPALAFLGFLGASVIPFLVGVPYMALILATVVGAEVTLGSVLAAGVTPFIVGGIVKAAAAALLIPLAWRGVGALDARK
ncbi:biotin transporter BioY [Microbacterium limosum]|uniref:Biotin transporter n=1 Tax=Microbacterium limosum TaxID=3079935 RepID=A0AAU0MDQ0_9MICO|nr:biotin transporter BioY [Microbacterium sp. Y20]WOQ68473.1 biotin transporter BioY [Microbacterium sp. Y20]